MAKIRVKIGNAEAEVEAELDRLQEAIELVPKLASKLSISSTEYAEGRPQRQPEQVVEAPGARTLAELPMVTLEKGDSLADVIGRFFSDPWGRERRKLSDVRAALQSYGLNYPKQSVAVALLRLAKTTKIRRFKAEDGEYVYTTSTPPVGIPETLTLA